MSKYTLDYIGSYLQAMQYTLEELKDHRRQIQETLDNLDKADDPMMYAIIEFNTNKIKQIIQEREEST